MFLIIISLVMLSGMCEAHEQCLNVTCKSGPNQSYCCKTGEMKCGDLTKPCTNKKCVFACYCNDGYCRNVNDQCIRIKDCPVLQCKVNERYNPCPAWCTFDSDCESYVNGWIRDCTTTPSGQINCVPRCECIDGFVRINGTCVSANFCCKVLDAIVVDCPAECDKTCDGKDVENCDKDNCFHKTCRCVPGFVRDDKGNCIPKENCPKCTDPNEVYNKCGPPCEPTCDNRNPICIPPAPCTPSCYCRKGYIRHNKKCIKVCDCPPQCKPTEVWNPCPKYCTFDADCDSYLRGIIKDCPPPPDGGIPCQPRCECKPGLVRINGNCVSPNLCCNDPNAEVLDCPARCEKECFALPTDTSSCVDNCEGRVCRCKKGFLFDITKKCVAPENCIPKLNCKKNEVYNRCPKPCFPGQISYCSEYVTNTPQECVPVTDHKCEPRCDCIEGYLRNKKGECVKKADCCDDPNAEALQCPARCEKDCNDLPTNTTSCVDNCKGIVCRCREGFLKDIDGKCVRPEKCIPKFTCKKYEVYNRCPKPCVPGEISYCSEYVTNTPLECVPVQQDKCEPRCDCIEGYLRNKKGECVKKANCCDDPNAEALKCPARCEKECHALPTNTTNCVDNCKGIVCRCRKGFLKDIDDKCVLPEKCFPKLNCKKYEVYNRCPKPCVPGEISYCSEYITNTPLECIPVVNHKCYPRCDCIEGYLRNKKGECVKKDECCDDPNAIAVKCPNPCPKTCDNLDTIDKTPCHKKCQIIGCTCREGYVLDSKGKCIKLSHCPRKCLGANEEYRACGPACEPTCQNRHPKCIPVAMCTPGCFCKPGFIRNEGKCVCPDECCDCSPDY